jgi:hypothetical protein
MKMGARYTACSWACGAIFGRWGIGRGQEIGIRASGMIARSISQRGGMGDGK